MNSPKTSGRPDRGTAGSLTWPHVLQREVLIRKAASIDGLSPGAIVVGEVARLRAQTAELHVLWNAHLVLGLCARLLSPSSPPGPSLPSRPDSEGPQTPSYLPSLGRHRPSAVGRDQGHE
uniref:Uncharacterized protein n=1 Tax=Canis lupus dingo TaxID=286419 RepID=A0A8C0KK77_CANLU